MTLYLEDFVCMLGSVKDKAEPVGGYSAYSSGLLRPGTLGAGGKPRANAGESHGLPISRRMQNTAAGLDNAPDLAVAGRAALFVKEDGNDEEGRERDPDWEAFPLR